MKAIELQLRSHKFLIYMSIAMLIFTIVYMVNLTFGNLQGVYRGVMVHLSDYLDEPNWSVLEKINMEVNESLFDYLKLVNNQDFLNRSVISSIIKMYRDASILYGLLWVVVSYVFLYDPLIRGHYKVYMNLVGLSRKKFLTIHALAAFIYISILGSLVFLGYSIFLFRAGFPYIGLSIHLLIAFLLGYISYHLAGLFVGVVLRNIELSLILILPLILLKPLPPSNQLLVLAPDMIYLYLLAGEYSDIISIWTVVISILFYLILGMVGVYMFIRGRRV